MKTESVLLKLINNDIVIGQLIHIDKNNIALYAPMLINYDVDGDHMEITLFPYNPLSETVMAIFELYHIVTYTVPKKSVLELYNKHWKKFYADLNETKEKMLKEIKDKYGEDHVSDVNNFQMASRKLH